MFSTGEVGVDDEKPIQSLKYKGSQESSVQTAHALKMTGVCSQGARRYQSRRRKNVSQAQDCPPGPLNRAVVAFQELLLPADQLHYLSQMLLCIQGRVTSSDAAGVCGAVDGVRSPAAVVIGVQVPQAPDAGTGDLSLLVISWPCSRFAGADTH